jgi:hypothetical protein
MHRQLQRRDRDAKNPRSDSARFARTLLNNLAAIDVGDIKTTAICLRRISGVSATKRISIEAGNSVHVVTGDVYLSGPNIINYSF